jgi:uncharacterized protein YvpB
MLNCRPLIYLGIIIFTASCAASTSNLSSTSISPDLPRKHVLDAVPQYYGVIGSACGPTSMRMVLEYYGIKISRKKIGEDVSSFGGGGTLPIDLINYAQALGFKVEDKEKGTINDIAVNIVKGRPVLVRQWLNMDSKARREASHIRVVIGYDADKQQIYLRDPYKKAPSEISFQEFNELWELDGRMGPISKNYMMVIYK